MNWWSNFHGRETKYPMCDECGHRMYRWKDAQGHWDGESYYCPSCSGTEDEGDDRNVSDCSACGNPIYPQCKVACDLM